MSTQQASTMIDDATAKPSVFAASQFATACHFNQRRKYTDRPYIEHPARVASRVSLLPGVTEEMVCAAWLHDVIEDCGVFPEHISRLFGISVAKLVIELTSTSKAQPDLSRVARKRMDRERIASISTAAKKIKLIDRIDNLRDMADAPADFAALYAAESRALATVLAGADAELEAELQDAIASLADREARKAEVERLRAEGERMRETLIRIRDGDYGEHDYADEMAKAALAPASASPSDVPASPAASITNKFEYALRELCNRIFRDGGQKYDAIDDPLIAFREAEGIVIDDRYRLQELSVALAASPAAAKEGE